MDLALLIMGIGWVVFGVIMLTQRGRLSDAGFEWAVRHHHPSAWPRPTEDMSTFLLVLCIVGGVLGLVGGAFMILRAVL